MRSSWEAWNPAWTAECVVWTIVSSHPFMVDLSDMRGELDILSAEEQFLSTQCRSHSFLWHTGTHCILIILIISNIISLLLLTLRRVSWNFFRVSLCQFYYEVPWFSWAGFQLSFKCLWPPLTRYSLSPGHHKKHLIWVDPNLMDPLELA